MATTKRVAAADAPKTARRSPHVGAGESNLIRTARSRLTEKQYRQIFRAWSASRLLSDAVARALELAANDRNAKDEQHLARLLDILGGVDVAGIRADLGAQQWTVEAQNVERGKVWLMTEVFPMLRQWLEEIETSDIKKRLEVTAKPSTTDPLMKVASTMLWPPTMRQTSGKPSFTSAWILASRPVLLKAITKLVKDAPNSGKWPMDRMALDVINAVMGGNSARDLVTDLRRWEAGRVTQKKRRSTPRK